HRGVGARGRLRRPWGGSRGVAGGDSRRGENGRAEQSRGGQRGSRSVRRNRAHYPIGGPVRGLPPHSALERTEAPAGGKGNAWAVSDGSPHCRVSAGTGTDYPQSPEQPQAGQGAATGGGPYS